MRFNPSQFIQAAANIYAGVQQGKRLEEERRKADQLQQQAMSIDQAQLVMQQAEAARKAQQSGWEMGETQKQRSALQSFSDLIGPMTAEDAAKNWGKIVGAGALAGLPLGGLNAPMQETGKTARAQTQSEMQRLLEAGRNQRAGAAEAARDSRAFRQLAYEAQGQIPFYESRLLETGDAAYYEPLIANARQQAAAWLARADQIDAGPTQGIDATKPPGPGVFDSEGKPLGTWPAAKGEGPMPPLGSPLPVGPPRLLPGGKFRETEAGRLKAQREGIAQRGEQARATKGAPGGAGRATDTDKFNTDMAKLTEGMQAIVNEIPDAGTRRSSAAYAAKNYVPKKNHAEIVKYLRKQQIAASKRRPAKDTLADYVKQEIEKSPAKPDSDAAGLAEIRKRGPARFAKDMLAENADKDDLKRLLRKAGVSEGLIKRLVK